MDRGTQCNRDTFIVAGKQDSNVEFYSDTKWICLVHIAMWLGVAVAVIFAMWMSGKVGCLWTFLLPALCSSSSSKKDSKENEGGEDE